MINTKSLPNKKPPSASQQIQSKQQLEQLYITAKVDLEQKNYSNQYKVVMEKKFSKNQINSHTRFTNNRSQLPLHYSLAEATDAYTRKVTGYIPLTEKQKFISNNINQV
jgi:hypothetical protein